MELDEQEIQDLYIWIDTAQYSRPKKNISRDFSDGGINIILKSGLCGTNPQILSQTSRTT
jgi:c-di-GMP-binding flagellar brake protein YcgR